MISTETVTENAALLTEEAVRLAIEELNRNQSQLKKQLFAQYESDVTNACAVSQLLRVESGILRAERLLRTARAVRIQGESTALKAQELETGLLHANETRTQIRNFRLYWPDWRKVMQSANTPKEALEEYKRTRLYWRKLLKNVDHLKFFDEDLVAEFLALFCLMSICNFSYQGKKHPEDYLKLKRKLQGILNVEEVMSLIQKDTVALAIFASFFGLNFEGDSSSVNKGGINQDDETNHSSNQKASRRLTLGKRDSFEADDAELCKQGFLSQNSLQSKKNSSFFQELAPGSVKPSIEGGRSAPAQVYHKSQKATCLSPLGDPNMSVASCNGSPVTRDTQSLSNEPAFEFKDCIQNADEQSESTGRRRPGMNETERMRLHGRRSLFKILADKLPLKVARDHAEVLESELFGVYHKDCRRYLAEVKTYSKSLESLILQNHITPSVLSTRLQYNQIVEWASHSCKVEGSPERDDDDISIRSFNSTASNLVMEDRLLDQIRRIPSEVVPKQGCNQNPDSMDLIEAIHRLRFQEIYAKEKKIQDIELENLILRKQVEPFLTRLKQRLPSLLSSFSNAASPEEPDPERFRI